MSHRRGDHCNLWYTSPPSAQRGFRVIESTMQLRPFQKRFIKGAFADGVDTGVLSIARGNGKSCLGAHILTRCLTPGDELHQAGKEYLLVASSLEQARCTYGFIRESLEATQEYRWLDSTTRVGITHRATNTRLRVLSSKAKSAFGIVGSPLLVFDEPGSLEVIGGQLLADAVQTAQGKPGSDLRLIFIGTIAPSSGGGWWSNLVSNGTQGSVYVQALVGDVEKWDKWPEIRRCNPLVSVSASFKKKLLEERDAARRDTRLKARFLSYRMNAPTGDESTMLLTVQDFEDMAKRPVPERDGDPICAVDLGNSRAWSAALVIYPSGRIECLAVAPGIPSLADQEARDRVPRGTYQSLADRGVLIQAAGLRVPPASLLVEQITKTWGRPSRLICDRFRVDELRDVGLPCRLESRVTRWSEAAFDIRSLRKASQDGPFAIAPDSRALLEASQAVASVKSDDQGSVRLIKRTRNNESRDDVASALTLAAGAFARTPDGPALILSRRAF